MSTSQKHFDYSKVLGIAAVALGLSTLGSASVAEAGAKFIVNPGESIQAAVDAASPGDKIIVNPGTYVETHGGNAAIRVSTDNLKLIAKSNFKKDELVIINPGPGNDHGILAAPLLEEDPDLQGFSVKGFTVQGFDNNGIQTRHVNKFKIMKNQTIDNAENGIFPILSANGLVKKNESYGSDDSALWVEGSENVRVLNNSIHDSPTGIEVTISNNVVVKKNEVFNNTVGIGLYHPSAASEPPLEGPMLNWKIEKNHVHDNNLPNSAPPGSIVAELPTGGGILVLGVEDVSIKGNLIENNVFYGVALVNWCLAQDGTPFNCGDNPPEANPNGEPTDIVIDSNTLIDNGTDPPPHAFDPLAADVIDGTIFPGSISGNCFKGNFFTTYETLGANPTPFVCS